MQNYESEEEILNSFKIVIPYVKNFFSEDVLLTISDRNRYVYVDGIEKFSINCSVGDNINIYGADAQAMKEKKTVSKLLSKETVGQDVRAISIPIYDQSRNVVGCLGIVKSIEKTTQIAKLSQELASALSVITEGIDHVNRTIRNVKDKNNKVLEDAKITVDKSKDTDEILSFVNNIASQTNLLGLNAAIESARAGEFGKGFGVVAQEIRKLSASSSESLKKIDDVLKTVTVSVSDITNNIQAINESVTEGAGEFDKINDSVKELLESSKILEMISKEY